MRLRPDKEPCSQPSNGSWQEASEINRLEDLSFEELLTQLMQASGHQMPAAPSSPNLRRLGKRLEAVERRKGAINPLVQILREIDGTTRGLPSETSTRPVKNQ